MFHFASWKVPCQPAGFKEAYGSSNRINLTRLFLGLNEMTHVNAEKLGAGKPKTLASYTILRGYVQACSQPWSTSDHGNNSMCPLRQQLEQGSSAVHGAPKRQEEGTMWKSYPLLEVAHLTEGPVSWRHPAWSCIARHSLLVRWWWWQWWGWWWWWWWPWWDNSSEELTHFMCWLGARYHTKQLPQTILFKSHNYVMRLTLLMPPIHLWGNRGTKWWSNICKVTQLASRTSSIRLLRTLIETNSFSALPHESSQ